jgi:hypothetical protein
MSQQRTPTYRSPRQPANAATATLIWRRALGLTQMDQDRLGMLIALTIIGVTFAAGLGIHYLDR